jgi:hypothetical protein
VIGVRGFVVVLPHRYINSVTAIRQGPVLVSGPGHPVSALWTLLWHYESKSSLTPRHDGSSAFTAYAHQPAGRNRPLWALCIDDTNAQAASADHVRHAVQAIHEKTWDFRSKVGRGEDDRVELIDLPVEADATADERVQKCKEHLANIIARNGAGKE